MKGFTLIETLLAVLILTIAIGGPLTIAARGLQATLISRDQMVAGLLAQDALEYVRFIRDTNRLNNKSWLAGLDGTSNGHTVGGVGAANCTGTIDTDGRYVGDRCIVDSLKDQVAFCGTALCTDTPLYYNEAGGEYSYQAAGNTVTKYTRTVYIALPSDNPKEADVRVVVQWKDRGTITRSLILRDNLYDWQ